MDWEVAKQLLIKARAVNVMSEDHMVRNNLCDLIDMILDELRTLKDSSSVCKHLSEDLLIDRLPPADPYVISPPSPPDTLYRSRPIRPVHPFRRGNAGDAK